ncbi:MAG: hypothetical protein OEV95_13455 [Gemmatimonadota bacterium]|nr:hypothetical protein [Gemmatimonadota bacterium]MDH5282461.1 hypothetical protein [Gemmatimonadota bacterium]
MSTAISARSEAGEFPLRFILLSAVRLGLIESVAVLLIGVGSRMFDGPAETAALGVLLAVALLAVALLPGMWLGSRDFEGIARAAAVGLAAAVVFLAVDVTFFQPFGLYTHRWRDVGGGSNWWYHPIWWMAGTYLPWVGAWLLAARSARHGAPGPIGAAITALTLTAVCGVVAIFAHLPGAGWNAPTFGVAFLPGLALATLFAALGARRK